MNTVYKTQLKKQNSSKWTYLGSYWGTNVSEPFRIFNKNLKKKQIKQGHSAVHH